MIISLRLKDDCVVEIDQLATAAGMSRSAWIGRAISDSMPRRPEEIRDTPAPVGKRTHVNLRLSEREIEAIDLVSARSGMTRMQWLKRTIRWQLWDRAGELRLAPFTVRAITRLTFQVRAIGRQLNQAVHAMHAANQPGSGLAIERIAGEVIAMEGRVLAVISKTADELQQSISGDVSYWTDRLGDGAASGSDAS